MADKMDMAVVVQAHVTGTVDADGNPTLTASYPGFRSPPHKDNTVVVGSDGKVDLNNLDYDSSKYTNQIGIWFLLESSNITGPAPSDPATGTYPCSFPSTADASISIDNDDNNDFTASFGNPAALYVMDKNKDKNQYNYNLIVWVLLNAQNRTGVEAPIDPVLINRGGNN